jgi:SAM-dependent methyltransferase
MLTAETMERIQEISRERLNPSLTNPNWLVLRARRDLFEKWLRNLPGNIEVLDVGGRIQPYRVLLEGKCSVYFSVDLKPTPLVNVVGRAEQLPFADGKFDLVICTQVLEYVPDPRVAVDEMYRSLKPGGFLLLSVPSVFPRDTDGEYWRFLPCGVRELLVRFSTLDLAAEGNSLIGFIRTVNVCVLTFAKPAALAKLISFSLVPFLNILGALVSRLTTNITDDRFAANFSAWAQK